MPRPPRTLTLPVKHYALVEGCPNFSVTGSIRGMRDQFYGQTAQLVRCGSWIYNIEKCAGREKIIRLSH